MNSILSSASPKGVPQSLAECLQIPEIATTLTSWAERIQKLGKYLGWIICIGGIISSLCISNELSEVFPELASAILIPSVLIWGLIACVAEFLLKVLAVSLNAHANAICDLHISANVALFTANTNPNTVRENRVPTTSGSWQCKFCGTTNHKSDAHCSSCGESQTSANRSVSSNADVWYCPHCGTQNKSTYGQCKKCGKYRTS